MLLQTWLPYYWKTSLCRSGNSPAYPAWRFSSFIVLACDSLTEAINGNTSSTRVNRSSKSSTRHINPFNQIYTVAVTSVTFISALTPSNVNRSWKCFYFVFHFYGLWHVFNLLHLQFLNKLNYRTFQGNTTCLRCDGQCYVGFVGNFIRFQTVKNQDW